jgi:hypothetical protein
MEIKLPINPRVREAIEKEMVGGTPLIEKDAFDPRVNNRHDSLTPLVDGLHKDFFRFNAGAGFVLNYVRFIEGLLTDDQADKFLLDTLKNLRISHLKVIHPQLDIDAMIMHLVRERFDKSSSQELKDLCVQKRDPEPLHPRNTQLFEMLKGVLVTHSTKNAPMAIALGQSKDLVLKHLKGVIDEGLTALDITPERCPHIRTGFLHHFLIAYPDLWNQANVEPYHFLGEPMIRMAPGRGMSVDKEVAWGSAGKSLIRESSGQIPPELMEFTLDYLVSIDPDVLDARHLLREGTRSDLWLDRCSNLEQGLPILERLLSYGLAHPALERIEGVVAKLSEASKRAALLRYAKVGDLSSEMAQAIVDTTPQVYDQVLDQLKKFPAIQRLADLKWPSNEQLLKLSPKNKRLLLEGDLGI